MLMSAVAWLTMQSALAGVPTTYFPQSLEQSVSSCRFGSKVVKLPAISAYEAGWYSGQLQATEEPSLYKQSLSGGSSKTSIRFTWLRSFHPAITVRVEDVGSHSSHVIAKQLRSAGGYAPGKIAATVDRDLTDLETQKLRELIAETQITYPPTHSPLLKECGPPGLDGAEWLVEVVDQRGYHFVKEWSPERGNVRRVGLALLALTGWTVDPIY